MNQLINLLHSLESALENARCPHCRATEIDPDVLGAIDALAEAIRHQADRRQASCQHGHPLDSAGACRLCNPPEDTGF